MSDRPSRRKFIALSGGLAATSLAGCLDGGGDEATPADDSDATDPTDDGSSQNTDDQTQSATEQSSLPDVAVEQNWHHHRADPQNTGVTSNTGPVEKPTRRWDRTLNEGVEATPALHDGTLIVGDRGGTIYGLDAASGETLWSRKESPYIGKGATVVDGTAYISAGDTLFALDPATGDATWTHTAPRNMPLEPIVVDGLVVTVDENNTLYAIDVDSGEVQYQTDTNGGVQYAMAADGTKAYIIAGGKLRRLDVPSGEWDWNANVAGGIYSGAVVGDGSVFVFGQPLTEFDAETGETTTHDSFPEQSKSPAYRDGVVYAGTFSKAVAYDVQSQETLWKGGINGYPMSAVRGDNLFASGDDIGCIDAASGETRWSIRPRQVPMTEPVIANGLFFVGGRNMLSAYQLP